MELTDYELRAANRTIAEALRNRRMYGQPIPDWMRRIERRFEREVSMSRLGHGFEAEGAQSVPDVWIGSREAGEILGLSKRQTNRIAENLGGDLVDGRRRFRKSVVEAYAEERRHGSADQGTGGG
jgi:hypothetical protein